MIMFFLQCSLSSVFPECGVYVSEARASVFGAREEDPRSQSSEEGECMYKYLVY